MTSRGLTTKKPLLKQSKPAFSAKAHGYQKRGIKFLLTHGAAALLLDPGMGKTAIVLKALDALKRAETNRRTLVIAPLRVCQLVWPAEPSEWSDLAHLRVGLLHGPNKQRVLDDHENYDILVINPEGLKWLLDCDLRTFKRYGFDTLVIDELTKFKSTKGVRFKLLKKVLHTFQRRWGLTGTPAPNGLIDLFGQMYVLDLGRSLGEYITHYRMNYFVNPDGQGWKWVLRAGADKLIHERLKPLAMRASAEDHLELPELISLRKYVDLPPKVRDLYDELEDELIAGVENKQIVAGNAAAASTKCRQIANGAVYVDDDLASKVQGKKRSVMELHSMKLDALEELVDELQGQPLLVAYEFNHDLDRLRARFKDVPYIGAGVSGQRAKEIESSWNAGDIPLLLGHPASMGHGLNFQKSDGQHVAWFGMTWDLELYDQFIKRVRRQGNKAKRVFVHHIMARDTVDETVWHVQRSKTKTQDALLLALQGRRK